MSRNSVARLGAACARCAVTVTAAVILLSHHGTSQRFNQQRTQQRFSNFPQQQFSPQFNQQQFEQLRSGGANFNCPERNGYFANPRQCDAYYKCEDGIAKEELCPEGLLFNDKASPFQYPCSYPSDVECLGRSALQPAQPTEDCPHQYGYFRLGDSANCGQFLNCAAGRGYVFDCPDGLAFDERTYQCNWPDQVPSCDPEAFLKFSCPEQRLLFGQLEPEVRFYRSATDCQHYFACVNGKPRRYNCGEGRAYSEEIGSCDGIENVTGCGSIPFDRRLAPVRLG